tara:strand:- start:31 stop:402 length:372 start_codon:yes stop_codon:yes gene_type:complete
MSKHGKYTPPAHPPGCILVRVELLAFVYTNEMQVQMFFGRNIPTGGYVDDQAWQQYQVLLDNLLDGMTILDGIGYWKGEQERMKVVSTSVEQEETVEQIVSVYKQMFNQDSVAVQYMPPLQFY